MKKIKMLLLTLIVSLVLPAVASAKEAVNVYIFKGETCGYCAKAIAFFNELKKEKAYKDKFNLIEYEIWKNEDNADLAEAVAEEMGDKLDGVPYIVIGEETFSGFTTSYEEDIKDAINNYYDEDERVDYVAAIKDGGDYNAVHNESSKSNDKENNADSIIAISIIAVAVLGFGYIIYLSRKGNVYEESTVKEPKKAVVEEEKAEPKKETEETNKETKENKTTKKTTPVKKTTTKKTQSKKNNSQKK